MRKFKISELECFSGVKAHTIRIWEQRYAIFKPCRTVGNIRYYSLEEVKLLLNIALLSQYGYKISLLSKMDIAAMAAIIDDLTSEEVIPDKAINDLIILMFTSEIEEFEDVLDGCVHVLGINTTVKNVILPFMDKVGLLSYNNSGTETHFAVTALRKKIILAIEMANPPAMMQKSALLFLSQQEHYDLVLLYAAYVLKCKGIRVLYLGTNISRQNLESITEAKKPDFLFTYVPQKHKFALASFVPYLSQKLPQTKFFVLSCEKETALMVGSNVEYMHYSGMQELFFEVETLC